MSKNGHKLIVGGAMPWNAIWMDCLVKKVEHIITDEDPIILMRLLMD